MIDITVGTAGHIDHGKTSLVKSLTGKDADRLPEEKERGITIDLGFAELALDGVRIGFVDVPGHEKFVKNMLAGASGIDMVLLVVAADEGVMPQTREHFEICRLLGVKKGIVVLTKSDLSDDDGIELARLQIGELVKGSFLGNAPVIRTSSKTGEGIEDIKEAILKLSSEVPAREDGWSVRLPIDRSFSAKGFGTVVTGTLASGKIQEGDELVVMPSDRPVRVRGVQTHGAQTEGVSAGTRTAVNLGGVEHESVSRGMVVTERGAMAPTSMIDSLVEVVEDSAALKDRQRIRLHLGTSEAMGRIHFINEEGTARPGEKVFAQIRVETPVVCVPAERLILRSYSPQRTVGGGTVLDNLAKKHRKRDLKSRLEALERMSTGDEGRIDCALRDAGASGMDFSSLRARTGRSEEFLRRILETSEKAGTVSRTGEIYLHPSTLDGLCSAVRTELEAFHRREPLSRGLSLASLREKLGGDRSPEAFRAALERLVEKGAVRVERDVAGLSSHNVSMSPDESRFASHIKESFRSAGLEVPKTDEFISESPKRFRISETQARKVLQTFIDSGEMIKVNADFCFMKESLEALKSSLLEHAAASGRREIDVPSFKKVAGVSRKYAIPLLEYLDNVKFTRRSGDLRVIL